MKGFAFRKRIGGGEREEKGGPGMEKFRKGCISHTDAYKRARARTHARTRHSENINNNDNIDQNKVNTEYLYSISFHFPVRCM